jgi:hypothetical protein
LRFRSNLNTKQYFFVVLSSRQSVIGFFLPLIFFTISFDLVGQNQVGNDFYGPGSSYFNGRSVAVSGDGSRIAIGASRVFSNGTFNGQVAVYDRNGNGWTETGSPIEGGATDRLGTSVAISSDGSTLVAGGTSNSQFGTNAGVARVFRWSGTVWEQLGQDLYGTDPGGLYGSAVAISADGTMIAVSAPRHFDPSFFLGLVEVYRLNSSGMWELVGEPFRGINFNGDERAGSDLALSADGNRIAIAHPFYRLNGFDRGLVGVYDLVNEEWQQVGDYFIGDDDDDETGSSVSLSADGNTIAIGDKDNDAFGQDNGTVKIYSWDGTIWNQTGSTLTEFGNAGISVGAFGFESDISDDGSRLVVTAPFGEAANGQQLGFFQLYEFRSGDWEKIGDQVEADQTFSSFGNTIGLSGDGLTVIIGASSDDGFSANAGLARVFDFTSVLPVELLSFEGSPQKNRVELSWSTTNEQNNSGFKVLYSINGTNWQKIDFVPSVGGLNQSQEYAYTHFAPKNGVNFYRLQQIDFDGSTSFSEIIVIEIDQTAERIFIYPNPVTNNVISLVLPYAENDYSYVVLDHSGRELLRGILTVGNNEVPLGDLKNGNYVVQLSTGSKTYNRKLTVIR